MKIQSTLILCLVLAGTGVVAADPSQEPEWVDKQQAERAAWLKQREQQLEENRRQLERWRAERSQRHEMKVEERQRHAETRRKQLEQYREWARERRENYLELKRAEAAAR